MALEKKKKKKHNKRYNPKTFLGCTLAYNTTIWLHYYCNFLKHFNSSLTHLHTHTVMAVICWCFGRVVTAWGFFIHPDICLSDRSLMACCQITYHLVFRVHNKREVHIHTCGNRDCDTPRNISIPVEP